MYSMSLAAWFFGLSPFDQLIITKDFLGKVFADDLIYTHSGGKIDSKETYINSIKEGKSAYNKIEVEELKRELEDC